MRWAAAVFALAIAGCGTGEDVFYVRSGDADMPVWVRGNRASPWLVLLVHGGPGGTGEVYQETDTFERLEQQVSVAYWDQRAAGSSQGNAATVASLTLDQYVSDLDAVVKLLKQRNPDQQLVLFGHSWGGTLTMAYLEDPERQARVAKWVCLDGPSSLPENEGYSRAWVIAQAQAKVDAGEDADHWREVLAWYDAHPEITPALAYDHFENLVALGGLVRDLKTLDVHASNSLVYLSPFGGMATLSNQQATIDVMLAEADSPNALLRTDVNPGLGGITLPSLLAWGRWDGDVPMPMGQLLYQRIGTPAADKQFVVLEHSAHSGQYEDGEALSGAVVDFLQAPLQ